MPHRPSEEGVLFWVELRQLLECPQVFDISVHWDLSCGPCWLRVFKNHLFDLFSLVSQVKIEPNGRVPLQIEHVAVDIASGHLLTEMIIISGIPGAE